LFPCNQEQSYKQPFENDEEAIQEQPEPTSTQDPRFDRKRSEDIALSVLDLSHRLLQTIVSQSRRKFEIVSPISIASALQLALLGANGMTFNELMDL